MRSSYAFFDLDGTLITEKSLLSFFAFYLEVEELARLARWVEFSRELAARMAGGAQREQLNAWFYRNALAGIRVDRLRELAARWCSERCSDSIFFNARVVDCLERHRAEHVGTVIVTGSFREVVAPVAERLNVDHVICAPLEEADGRYTGALTARPTIGKGKLAAVDRFIAAHDVDAASCFGYGDDHTDIDFLRRLGRPRVPANSTTELLLHALGQGWDVLEP